jgi:hypothetical protein
MISGKAEFFPWQRSPREYISVSLRHCSFSLLSDSRKLYNCLAMGFKGAAIIHLTFEGNQAQYFRKAEFFCLATQPREIDRRFPKMPRKEYAMWHIFASRLSFAPDVVIGVGLIGIYFVWIVCAALYRVRQGDHMGH